MRSLKIKVRLKDGFKVIALLDTGAEMDVMTRDLIEDINLAMRQGLKLELVSHMRYSYPFFGLCNNVEVAIKEFKIRHPIFGFQARDHDFVLGQLFLNSIKFIQKYKLDRIFNTIMHPHCNAMVT